MSGNKIVTIHQPNFFPWLGFFRKLAISDVFVFLDAVPFPRTDRGTWINRVMLIQGGTAKWFTCPIIRGHGIQMDINQIEIDPSQNWRRRLVKTLEVNYSRAPYYKMVMPMLIGLINHPEPLLATYNELCVRQIARELGLSCQFERQSALADPVRNLKGSERLARICQQLGGKVYLAGDGADGYEEIAVYQRLCIELRKSGFVPRSYSQVGQADFVPRLSVVDALLNLGFENTAELLV